jgi:transglutaminase-like putative cysteine protease
MRIRAGFELIYDCPKPTPMLLTLSVHPSRAADLANPEQLSCTPALPLRAYVDGFGNLCHRIVAPAGRLSLSGDVVIHDTGTPDTVAPYARQSEVAELPDETLIFLLGSRYCETDRLSDVAWSLFAATPMGWTKVQAICDFVHRHVAFDYAHARSNKSALDVFRERIGVCRDFAHLAITLCRCMNIPARYCTGYLGDIGVARDPAPMDFSAWFEAWLDGRWYTFDARHNVPRIGRILMGRGRDATDVPISNAFGANTLAGFRVWTDEVAM